MAAPKIDILVNLLSALQPDPAVTTIPLNDADQPLDYSRLIGQKIIDQQNLTTQLVSSLNSLYSQFLNLETAYNSLVSSLTAGDYTPQVNGVFDVMPDNASYPVEQVVYQVCIQFIAIRSSLGSSTQLTNAVAKQNVLYTPGELKNQSPLSTTSYATMSGFPGWIASPTKVADTLNNMWITINDMRLALSTVVDPASPVDCSSISVGYTFTIDSVNNTLRFFFAGNCTIPEGFYDTSSVGGLMVIDDNVNPPYNININLTNAVTFTNGFLVNLSDSGINPFLPLRTTYTYSLTNGTLTCTDTLPTVTTTATYSVCVPLTVSALSTTTAQAFFNPLVKNNITYSIQLYNNLGTTFIADSGNFVNPSGPVSYVFVGLVTATTYQVRIKYTFNGSTYYYCSFNSVTTP